VTVLLIVVCRPKSLTVNGKLMYAEERALCDTG
jgi:hypothetical protein